MCITKLAIFGGRGETKSTIVLLQVARPPAAKAGIHSERLRARLEAAPFHGMPRTFFSRPFSGFREKSDAAPANSRFLTGLSARFGMTKGNQAAIGIASEVAEKVSDRARGGPRR